MPVLTQIGGMSAPAFGLGGGASAYWWLTLDATASPSTGCYAGTVDSLGNLYAYYPHSLGGGSYRPSVAKFTSTGALVWNYQVSTSGSPATYQSVDACQDSMAIDSSDNLYFQGYPLWDACYGHFRGFYKIDSSGTMLASRSRDYTNVGINAGGLAIDSSGNIHTCGYTTGGSYATEITKLSSAFSITWNKSPSVASNPTTRIINVKVDGSSNVYGFGTTNVACTSNKGLLFKWDSSAATTWWRKLDAGGGQSCSFWAGYLSATHVYAVGYASPAGTATGVVTKWDTSGTLTWQRGLQGANANQLNSVLVDSSGNVYAGGDYGYLAKWNSSGTLQWQRTLRFSSANYSNFFNIRMNADETKLYLFGRQASGCSGYPFVACYPADGSKTGTYGSLTIAAGSATDMTPTMTDSSGTDSPIAGSTTTLPSRTTSMSAWTATPSKSPIT